MRKRSRSLHILALVASFTLASTLLAKRAEACSLPQQVKATTYRGLMQTAAAQYNDAVVESNYAKLLDLPPTCIRLADHNIAGGTARHRGDIGAAIQRYQLAGNTTVVAQLNQLFGKVEINAATIGSPRTITWPGFRTFSVEERRVFDFTKAGFIQAPVFQGYLPPGTYILSAGFAPQHHEVTFVVTANHVTVANYP